MLRVSGNTIHASGIVGYEDDGFTRDQMVAALSEMSGDIVLKMQSPGGDVFDGQSIYNQLRDYPGKVTCMVDALSGSIATVIQCAADMIVANPNSNFMVHGPSAVAMGQSEDLRRIADQLDKLKEDAAAAYSQKTGKGREEWISTMSQGEDVWYTAKQALDVGLVDQIAGQPNQQASVPAVQQQVASTSRLQVERAKAVFRQRLIDYYARNK